MVLRLNKRGIYWHGAMSKLSFREGNAMVRPFIFTLYVLMLLLLHIKNPCTHKMWLNKQHVRGCFFIMIMTIILKPTARQRHTAALLVRKMSWVAFKRRPPTLCWWWWLMPPMVWNCKLWMLSGTVCVTMNNTQPLKIVQNRCDDVGKLQGQNLRCKRAQSLQHFFNYYENESSHTATVKHIFNCCNTVYVCLKQAQFRFKPAE